jgi:hypothetical protein
MLRGFQNGFFDVFSIDEQHMSLRVVNPDDSVAIGHD